MSVTTTCPFTLSLDLLLFFFFYHLAVSTKSVMLFFISISLTAKFLTILTGKQQLIFSINCKCENTVRLCTSSPALRLKDSFEKKERFQKDYQAKLLHIFSSFSLNIITKSLMHLRVIYGGHRVI